MEDLNKDLNSGLILENTTSTPMENNHVGQDPEPAFSDEEEEMPLRFVFGFLSDIHTSHICSISSRIYNLFSIYICRIVTKVEEEEDEEDVPLATVKLKNEQKNANCVAKKEDITSQLNLILEPEELRTAIGSLHSESDNEIRCQAVERIVQMVVEDEIDAETVPGLASCLSTILSTQITAQIFPSDNLNEESLTDSISTPLFVMFRNQYQLCKEEDNRRKLLARVLAEMYSIQPKIGYLLLYFLKVWGREEEKREGEPRLVEVLFIRIKTDRICHRILWLLFFFSMYIYIYFWVFYSNVLNDVKASVYKDFCAQREKKLDACLVADLKVIASLLKNKSMIQQSVY